MKFRLLRRVILVVSALMLGIILSSCVPSQVRVALYSYQINVDKSTIPPGPVTFYITNHSKTDIHELEIYRTELAPYQLPRTLFGKANTSFLTGVTGTVRIFPGDTRKLDIDLAQGHYVVIGNQADDYDLGMYAEFTVK